MGGVGIGHLFPTHQLTADKGVLKTQRERVKLVHRNQEGCFSFNSVYINKGKINQDKNEKIINCFPLFNHLISILAFLSVGALPWKKKKKDVTFSRTTEQWSFISGEKRSQHVC